MAEYKQLLAHDGQISATILRVIDMAYIPNDPGNRDRREYEVWLAAGNTPDPPDPLPDLPPPGPLELAADPTDAMHAATKGYVDREVSRATGGITLPAKAP